MPSLDGESIEDFATRVFDAWKLGQKGKDNGVLVIVAPNDRRMRIEVGYGLEGTLTDAQRGADHPRPMTPRFKTGDYDGGIAARRPRDRRRRSKGSAADAAPASRRAEAERGSSTSRPHRGRPAAWPMRILLGAFIFGIIGLFTFIGIVTPGMGWFLYVFLIPFWAMFPIIIVGVKGALVLLTIYVVGFPIAKLDRPSRRSGTRRRRDLKSTGSATIGGMVITSSGGSGGSSSIVRRRILRRRRQLRRRRRVGKLVSAPRRRARGTPNAAAPRSATRRLEGHGDEPGGLEKRGDFRRVVPGERAPRPRAPSRGRAAALVAQLGRQPRVAIDRGLAAQRMREPLGGATERPRRAARRADAAPRRARARRAAASPGARGARAGARAPTRGARVPELERAAVDDRGGEPRRQVQRGRVLPVERRGESRAVEATLRDRERRGGSVGAVDRDAERGQRNEQPARAAHRVEDDPRVARQAGEIPATSAAPAKPLSAS